MLWNSRKKWGQSVGRPSKTHVNRACREYKGQHSVTAALCLYLADPATQDSSPELHSALLKDRVCMYMSIFYIPLSVCGHRWRESCHMAGRVSLTHTHPHTHTSPACCPHVGVGHLSAPSGQRPQRLTKQQIINWPVRTNKCVATIRAPPVG